MKQLKPKPDKIFIFSLILLIIIGLFFVFLDIALKRPGDLIKVEAIIAYIIILIIIGAPFILSITYLYTDLTKKVFINESLKQIIIIKKGKKAIITQSDIVESYLIKVIKRRGTWHKFPYFKYLLLVLKERERVYITNLLVEPESLIELLNIDCKLTHRNVPFISKSYGEDVLTSKEFEEKVLEFEHNFKDHTDSMLLNIVKQKKDYTDYAREAASRILEKRKH